MRKCFDENGAPVPERAFLQEKIKRDTALMEAIDLDVDDRREREENNRTVTRFNVSIAKMIERVSQLDRIDAERADGGTAPVKKPDAAAETTDPEPVADDESDDQVPDDQTNDEAET